MKIKALIIAFLPALLATFALTTSFVFSFMCSSIKFELEGDHDSLTDLHFGPFYQEEVRYVDSPVGGGYKVEQRSCVDWETDSNTDASLKFVRSMAVIVPLVGGLLAILLWFRLCLRNRISERTWKIIALIYILMVAPCQGLTFLIFKSNACRDNPVVAMIEDDLNQVDLYPEKCAWNEGSTANVFSVFLWFAAGLSLLFLRVPEPSILSDPETLATTSPQTTSPKDPTEESVKESNDLEGKGKSLTSSKTMKKSTLLGMSLLITLIQVTAAKKCPYDILIERQKIRGDGTECFEAPTEAGVHAFVSGSEADAIVIWDKDAPCPNGGSYIHYAANGNVENVEPMTAGAGAVVHTYRAAIFKKGLPLPAGTTSCNAFDTLEQPVAMDDLACLQSWQVARFGNLCPDVHPRPHRRNILAFLGSFALVAGLAWSHRHKRWFPRSKVESYIALSTIGK